MNEISTPHPVLETARLIIRPLTHHQLQQYLLNDHSLEAELHLNPTHREISTELKEALEQTIIPAVANPHTNYLYATLWTIILKEDMKMVGDICIIGEPNAEGEIEIGYGTYDAFQKKGYMTEAVAGLIGWAKTQPDVVSIVASTNTDNIPSYTILQKNNFSKTGETENLIHWKLSLR